jgi:triosephosphate isomerase (TIM)
MRKKIIAGNWKMNKTISEGVALVDALKAAIPASTSAEVLVCPPYLALSAVKQALGRSSIGLGAQGMFWKDGGAYTSYVSGPMLVDVGVTYVIIGHSETRGRFGVAEPDLTGDLAKIFGETDASVNKKVIAALGHKLRPIICVGETLAERQAGSTDSIVRDQVAASLAGVAADALATEIVFAYEPVWAIGTGEVCAADEADRVCGLVRSTVGELYGPGAAESVRIQYGGSMKPDNAAELLGKPNIDGGLIGGASLKAVDFAAIVAAAG